MDILTWIVLGLVVGFLANVLDPHPTVGGGVLGNIVLGIVGAVVGGFLGNTFFGVGVSGFNFSSLVLAVLGALIVMWLVRLYRNRQV